MIAELDREVQIKDSVELALLFLRSGEKFRDSLRLAKNFPAPALTFLDRVVIVFERVFRLSQTGIVFR